MITLRSVPFDDPAAQGLWFAQQSELVERYGKPDIEPELSESGLITSVVGATSDGSDVACGLVRWVRSREIPAGTSEVKRLYVAAEHRGHGHSRVVMGELEEAARRAGVTRIYVETGVKQPEAIALYEAIGYSRIENFGPYVNAADSVCLAKELRTRVVVINGTIGAGKTSVAVAMQDELVESGAAAACIDADGLCQAEPAPEGDRYRQGLWWKNLAAVAPNYREAGCGIVVISRVVEDAEDRERYARAFAVGAGPATVTMVRLRAPEKELLARLERRTVPFAKKSRAQNIVRMKQLHGILEDLDLDDYVVDNVGGDAHVTARAVLGVLGL